MDLDRLASLLERPDVQRRILDKYEGGGFSLGLTRDPRQEDSMAIRVRIEGDDSAGIPSEIVLEGEAIPIIVNTRFKTPVPLKG